jgi:glycosyltransferase involved in cell wall biosynthesis
MVMNVLFDAGILGSRKNDASQQTGVFRVAEEFARGLARSERCKVRFCAGTNAALTFDYLEAHRLSVAETFAHSKTRVQLSRIINPAANYITATTNDRRFSRRLARRVMGIGASPIDKISTALTPEVLEWAEVYHTPDARPSRQIERANKPHVRLVTVYDLVALKFPQFYDARIAARMKRHLKMMCDNWVIAISNCTRNDILNHFRCDASKVFAVPLAASAQFRPVTNKDELAQVRKKYCIPPGPYIASLCTLEPRKNLDFVIRNFRRLVLEAKHTNLSLVLIGNIGWKMEKIDAALAECSDIRRQIVITGRVPDSDVASLYSGATGFVYMSLYEGFGLPPLEAMQCGAPVITSDTSSLPEVVGSGGQLIAPRDGDAFCHALLRLLDNSVERELWAQRAIAQARQFSWDRSMRLLTDAYQSALHAAT